MNRSFVGCLGKLSNGYSPVTSQQQEQRYPFLSENSNFLIEMGSAALVVETSTGNKETRIFQCDKVGSAALAAVETLPTILKVSTPPSRK